MKFSSFGFRVSSFCICLLLVMAGCMAAPADNGLSDSLVQARQAVSDMKAAAAAATQPVVLPAVVGGAGGAATQPTTVTMPAEVVKAAAKADAALAKADQALAAAQALATAATQPGANPGTALMALAPLTGSAAPWVALGGTVLGLLWQRRQNQKAAEALTGVHDGLQAAIKTGAITVTPAASTVVNAAVPSHPAADKVVDLLTDASNQPRIAG